jgi:CelD/BcsL family acetyltransferase involved in cellulose biosynthesis
MTSALSVSFIRDEAGLAALAPEWWRLWERAPAATQFQSPAWLIAWWRAFSPGQLLTIAVHIGDRLVGLAPFYLERNGPRTRLLPVGISISDYLDVLADAAFEAPVLAAIANAYAACPEPWTEWEMPELRPGATALRLPAPRGCDDSTATSVPCTVLSIGAGPSPKPALRGSMKRHLRLARNRMGRHGVAQILSTADRDPSWWVAQLWRLHEARWASRGEPGLLRDARLRPFHLDAMPELASRKVLRLYALMLGARVVGVYYGFHHGDCAAAYLGGFDPELAHCSPGTLLLGHAINEAAAEGAREVHFLRGGEPYKYAWGPTERWNSRRLLRRPMQ